MTKKTDVLAKIGLILIEAEIRQQKKQLLTEEWTQEFDTPKNSDGKTV